MKRKLFVLAAVIALVAVATVFLVACAPSTPEKAKEKFDKESGYLSVPLKVSNDQKEDGVTGMFGTANKDGEYLFAIWFSKSAEAKAYTDKFKTFLEEDVEPMLKIVGLKLDDEAFKTVKRSGKVVYVATEGAEKIFKAL